MKKIIVATDFSNAGNNACLYAAEMAVKIKADLILLHVVHLPLSATDLPVTFDVAAEKKEAMRTLGLLQQALCGKVFDKISISTAVFVGTFFYELNRLCEKIAPFVVVLGSQGRSAMERTFLGEHAVYTLKHLPWSVLAVPEDVHFTQIKKVGLACDMQQIAKTLPTKEVREIIQTFHAELHVINTESKASFSPDSVYEAKMLYELLDDLSPSYDMLTGKNDDETIIEFAEKNNIDLLVVLPKRHTLIDKLLHHSHTRRFVLCSGVPVLTIHSESSKKNSAIA